MNDQQSPDDRHPALAYLSQLQVAARESARTHRGRSPDFHYDLGLWIDDRSAAAKILRAYATNSQASEQRHERHRVDGLGDVGGDAGGDADADSGCAICGHDPSSHQPDERLPGHPRLCFSPVGQGNECGCDGDVMGDGQSTINLFDRVARLYGTQRSDEWWNGYNQTLGARPVDLMSPKHRRRLEGAIRAAEHHSGS